MDCLFASDLGGDISKYNKLFNKIASYRPDIVLLGGDLLPFGITLLGNDSFKGESFIEEYLFPHFSQLREEMKEAYPTILIILGNDDFRSEESLIIDGDRKGYWKYLHKKSCVIENYIFFGYGMVPPSPFLIKDWERYDVSRYVDPGAVSPEEGWRTVEVSDSKKRYSTIKDDLDILFGDNDVTRAVCLFHSPPYQTNLDRANLDGKMIDHVPLDVHVGSIAIRRFIEARQPLLTLHGHIHEAARLTGQWRDKIEETVCFNAAHDGPELALIKFNLENLNTAIRELI